MDYTDWKQMISVREDIVFRGFEVQRDERDEPEAAEGDSAARTPEADVARAQLDDWLL